WILADASRRAPAELIDKEWSAVPGHVDRGRVAFIVSQRMLQSCLPKLAGVCEGRKLNVGNDAAELSRTPGHAVEFLNGQLQRACIIRSVPKHRHEPSELEHGLDGAFAECTGIADDDGSAIVLHSRS